MSVFSQVELTLISCGQDAAQPDCQDCGSWCFLQGCADYEVLWQSRAGELPMARWVLVQPTDVAANAGLGIGVDVGSRGS